MENLPFGEFFGTWSVFSLFWTENVHVFELAPPSRPDPTCSLSTGPMKMPDPFPKKPKRLSGFWMWLSTRSNASKHVITKTLTVQPVPHFWWSAWKWLLAMCELWSRKNKLGNLCEPPQWISRCTVCIVSGMRWWPRMNSITSTIESCILQNWNITKSQNSHNKYSSNNVAIL